MSGQKNSNRLHSKPFNFHMYGRLCRAIIGSWRRRYQNRHRHNRVRGPWTVTPSISRRILMRITFCLAHPPRYHAYLEQSTNTEKNRKGHNLISGDENLIRINELVRLEQFHVKKNNEHFVFYLQRIFQRI